MHVAYLIPTIDRIGGAERQVVLLATGMAQRGCQVTVIALSGNGGKVAAGLTVNRISFLSLGMRKGLADPRGWIKLHRWIRFNRPDVVHAHLPHAAMLARWSRLVAPVRVLIDTIHSPAIGGFARRMGYRLSAWLPDAVTAVSVAAADPWLNSAMVNDAALAIVPNGVDVDHWRRNEENRDESRRLSGLAAGFVWLAVGRLDPVKDHETMLRAFAILPFNARLLIAGSGPLEDTLRQLSRDLGIDERVQFLGFQSDIRRWMHAADGFVLSSHWEGLPVALMEACACELPAVVTNTPGIREVITDLPIVPVTAGDASTLAAAMNAMMRLPNVERRELGMRARISVSQRFSLPAALDQYEALYRETLARNLMPSRSRAVRSLSSELSRSNTRGR